MYISGGRKLAIFLVIVTIIGAGSWFGYSKWYLPTHSGPQSHQIQGQITDAIAGGFNILGTHILDANPVGSDFSHPVSIKVNLDSKTKFVKTNWSQPTQADFANFHPPLYAKQSGQTQAGSLSDLKNQQGMLVIIKTVDGSFGKNEVTASEIDYSLPPSQNGYGYSGKITKSADNTISVSGTFFIQNSPSIFMNQSPATVSFAFSPDTKFFRLLVPKIDPSNIKNQPTNSASKPVEVASTQLIKDMADYTDISISALSPTNVFGLTTFTPNMVYYVVFQPVVK